jgi:hypothetical protein
MVVESFIFGTAVVFTLFGYSVGRTKANYDLVEQSVATTIDSLAKDGYLKTVGSGDSMIILKHDAKDDQAT